MNNSMRKNPNSIFSGDGIICTKRALSDAFRAHKAHAAQKGRPQSRRALKAAARQFPMFHVYWPDLAA